MCGAKGAKRNHLSHIVGNNWCASQALFFSLSQGERENVRA